MQDAVDGAEDVTEEQSEDEVMQVFFQGIGVCNILSGELYSFGYTESFENEITAGRYPVVYTDTRANQYASSSTENEATLSLDKSPFFSVHSDIDKNNLLCIKFVTDEVPDPTRIYVFHNKRFICQKIEIQVGNEGIERLKTGYFYEII